MMITGYGGAQLSVLHSSFSGCNCANCACGACTCTCPCGCGSPTATVQAAAPATLFTTTVNTDKSIAVSGVVDNEFTGLA